MTWLPAFQSLHFFFGGFTCKVHFACWCSRRPSINDGGNLALKYPSSLTGVGVTLGHVFSPDSHSFPCGVELQLPIMITASHPPSSNAFPALSHLPSSLLVSPSLPKQGTFTWILVSESAAGERNKDWSKEKHAYWCDVLTTLDICLNHKFWFR